MVVPIYTPLQHSRDTTDPHPHQHLACQLGILTNAGMKAPKTNCYVTSWGGGLLVPALGIFLNYQILFMYLFGCICSMQKFPGQVMNPRNSSDNARSSTTRPPRNSLNSQLLRPFERLYSCRDSLKSTYCLSSSQL